MKTHIAVIDDGINEKYYDIGQLKYNIEIAQDLCIRQRIGYDPFLPSHGTTCGAIIKGHSSHAVLSSVKVLNYDSKRGMKVQLIKALEWCVENEIRLVNLSLGTIDYRDFLDMEKVIKKVTQNGVIIVAACNNSNIFTCPASLENVIGVMSEQEQTLKEYEYIYNLFSPIGIDITASGSHELVKFNGEKKITERCNSFAAPAVTAAVFSIMKNNLGLSLGEIKNELRKGATAQIDLSSNYKHYGNSNAGVDAPVIVLYNHCENELNGLSSKLTERFRINGYNAISVVQEESEEDLCNGWVFVKSSLRGEKRFLKDSIQLLYKVYDPDIILVPFNMKKADRDLLSKEITPYLDVDIEIHIYENLNIEIVTSNETKIFSFFEACQIDEIYSYIINLFDKDENKNEVIP